MNPLQKTDPEFYEILQKEEERQQTNLSMIASENIFSPAVHEAVGSVFSHKYSEGNMGARYYEGNQFVDEMEALAVQRARKLFRLPDDWDVNVQALSGCNANLAVYLAVLEPGDTLMAMYLPDGGHLSHGWSYEPDADKREAGKNTPVYLGGSRKVNITSKLFRSIQYKTDPDTRVFDYDEIEKIAKKYKPKLIITGGTAYPRNIDYERMRQIADSVEALYMADIAHEAGLGAAGVVPSPVGIADIVTMTTHKTLRSGRGAIILARQDLMKKINRGVLPGLQGGPHNHNIAGICVGLGEALRPEFALYARQILANAEYLADQLVHYDFNLVSGGTDKHLVLIDLTSKPLLGKKYARALNWAGIVANYSTMPGDTRPPADPSALRVGTPLATTRGMKEKEMVKVASWMNEVMEVAAQWKDLEFAEFEEAVKNSPNIARVASEVRSLCQKFPLKIEAKERARARA
ncbi:MAG: serine hydroxymethyltransferase [Patescibacteria group bacterium]